MSALLRVAELNAAYAATIDADGLEAWPDFFVEDCLYKITSAENHRRGYGAGIIYADLRAMLRDRVTGCAPPISTSAKATAISSACRCSWTCYSLARLLLITGGNELGPNRIASFTKS
jgi:3-phenylpropionate/cinnamic acid dioxygenase small subunit